MTNTCSCKHLTMQGIMQRDRHLPKSTKGDKRHNQSGSKIQGIFFFFWAEETPEKENTHRKFHSSLPSKTKKQAHLENNQIQFLNICI